MKLLDRDLSKYLFVYSFCLFVFIYYLLTQIVPLYHTGATTVPPPVNAPRYVGAVASETIAISFNTAVGNMATV